jgi:tetraacyldisaccharide 4'-kinase
MRQALTNWWQTQALLGRSEQSLAFILITYPLSCLYGLGQKLFQKERAIASLPGVTISVGNLAVGGTGKSPVVVALARHLLERGFRPAILTRGYGSGMRSDESLILLSGSVVASTMKEVRQPPDEAMMQSVALPTVPVIAGARRLLAARYFMASNPEQKITHWLLDDGFQHRQLHRDIDLVLLDAYSPFGNGALLPRGPLREPPSSLKRATAVLLTRFDATNVIKNVESEVQEFFQGTILRCPFKGENLESAPGSKQAAETQRDNLIKSANFLLVAGIAQPTRLLAELRGAGILIKDCYFVRDHASFDPGVLQKKLAAFDPILTTVKDYWRDPAFFQDFIKRGHPVWLRPIQAILPSAQIEEILGRFRN